MCNARYTVRDAILGETNLSRGKVDQPATLLKTEFGLIKEYNNIFKLIIS